MQNSMCVYIYHLYNHNNKQTNKNRNFQYIYIITSNDFLITNNTYIFFQIYILEYVLLNYNIFNV